MDKNIEEIVLAICQDRENARLKTLEKEFIELIQFEFDECLKTFSPWKGVGTSFVTISGISRKFSRKDCDYISSHLGFIFKHDVLSTGVSIPEWDGTSTPTYAQNMLIMFNAHLKSRIENEKEKISETFKSISEDLISGNFHYSKSTNFYTITVDFDFSNSSELLKSGLIKKLYSCNFSNIEISKYSLKFSVKEKTS